MACHLHNCIFRSHYSLSPSLSPSSGAAADTRSTPSSRQLCYYNITMRRSTTTTTAGTSGYRYYSKSSPCSAALFVIGCCCCFGFFPCWGHGFVSVGSSAASTPATTTNDRSNPLFASAFRLRVFPGESGPVSALILRMGMGRGGDDGASIRRQLHLIVEDDSNNDSSSKGPPGLPPPEMEKNQIVVSSEVELPFSADIAYDAFLDLPRQPTWSPWLRSVEYVDDANTKTNRESKWTLKYLGIKVQWNAVTTKSERPRIIEWESISGVRNKGRVEFTELDLVSVDGSGGENNSQRTKMRLTMTFIAPKLFVRLFGGDNSRFHRVVERRLVRSSLLQFREIVLENDVPKSSSSSSSSSSSNDKQ